ncbi:MAG: HYR domain-containing protein [Saprospiraceae bacterium]|nr:HYR domain-containing protein [Saprospiraceae bacterium]MBK9722259.1 HYR domain-containing protein [Saprospiraceae bacterium]
MKINFLTNPFKIGSNALMLIFLFLSTGIFAQPQSGTCYFVGETVVNGVNTNDTLPRLFVGLAPGSCRAATINVPKPPLNTPGCASIQLSNNGPVTPRDETGCSFGEGCNTCFGCGVITTTAVPGVALAIPGPPTTPPSPLCQPFIPAIQLVIAKLGTASFGDTYTLSIAPAPGGPYTPFGTYTSGNGVTQFYTIAPGLYTAAGNNYIRPDHAWGGNTTFGECLPTFQFRTGGAFAACIDSNMTPGAGLDTFSAMAGTYYRVFRSFQTSTCQLVRAVLPIVVQDLEPPVIIGCPKAVIINLGPGECEASWDAPPFMAMDNCPAATFLNQANSIGCQTSFTFCGYDAVNPSGFLFNLTNNTARPMAILGFPSFFSAGCAGITSTAGIFSVFAKTTPNTGWEVGLTGYNGNPATQGCNGVSPKTLWTLVKTSTAADGIRALPVTQPALDTMLLGAAVTPSRDTVYACDGSFTVNIGSGLSSNLILSAGETRGIYIGGALGTRFEMIAPAFGSCNAGRPFGDGICQINTGLITGGIASNTATVFGNLGTCRPIGYVGNVMYAGAETMVRVRQTCGRPYGPGCYFPVGCTKLCYEATDAAGNRATCTFDVCVNAYPNTVTALACHDEIQISLNENCFATISADEVLSGGPYKCYDDYIVEIRDWVTNAIIDRQPNVPGIQVGIQDIGRELKITVRDPATGNSCWGHATVEDKLPPRITCPRDTCVPCYSPVSPDFTGSPVVVENCGGYSLSFKDNVAKGGCPAGNDRIITRTWTAIDAYNNKATCVQSIMVSLGSLSDAVVPLNYDNIENPMLNCNEKIDHNKDVTPHYLAFPYCVDGYLLDSAHWFATGGFLPSPNGDLAGERLPRTLGWNCLDSGPYAGHPSPYGVYYPAHPNWRPNNPVCWGPDEVVMWHGTGFPGGVNCGNLGVTYQDIVIDLAKPGCDAGPVGCYKVLRQWTVLDWCTSEVGGHNQIIKVVDAEAPKVLYPDTVNVNMEVWTCTGRWEVPPAWIVDNCSNELHYTVEVEDGTVLGNETSGYVVVDMPIGVQSGYVIAEDCCGNITKKRIALNVFDNVPPIAVCEAKTVVSINGNQSPGENFAKIFAESFDQGSFDNCQPHIFFKVIRMEHLRGTNNGSNANQPDNGTNCASINGDDNAILDGNQIYFDDHVKFCCSDVGKTIMVVFRVFDREPGNGPIAPSRMNSGGNLFNRYSDCMVEVEVQDKSVPTVVAPPNIVVSCWFWFDVDKLVDPNDATFGKVVTDLSNRAKVKTTDLVCYNYCVRNDITGYPGFVPGAPPSNPPAWNKACDYYRSLFDTAHYDRKYELVWGFDGYVLSSCGNTPTISVNDNRECGQGQITRTVVARGPNGISVTATQIIWVVDCDPFYINRADNCDPDDDITWPGNCTGQATTIAGCGADISPDNPLLGRPVVENGADDLCALISIEYFDEIFTIEPDACFKVLRKWVVIDWCQYDPSIDPVKGRWEYLQIIKVHDTDKPVVSIEVGPCEPAVKNATDNICYGHISIVADATDNCSPLDWLFYDYKIDLYNDGIGTHQGYDFKVGPLTRKEYAAGRTPLFHHNPLADNENNPFEASGTYPIGIHKICWFVEDGCGNIGTLCQLFEVKDCKAPTPYCLTGVITVPMPASKCVTVWAKDLDRGSFDNCTNADDLLFYFNGDTSATSITICCDDFVAAGANDELLVDVQMWVQDEEGNTDYCKTVIIIQDNQDICPNTGSVGKVEGNLRTENDDQTELADVQLLVSSSMMKNMITSNSGEYLFGDLKPNTYSVKPSRNDDPLNGVSTKDIVKIQRHILGIETLNSPYKLIAADVNTSASITAADVSEIRKLILGVSSKFNKSESWTFVPKNYVFATPTSPWNAPRQVNVTVIKEEKFFEDFVAVKMGDVTTDARGHNVAGSSSRNNGKLHLEIDNNTTVSGELYKVAFKSSDFNNIAGYQFTMKFDRQALTFEGIEAGSLNVDESNFGTNQVGNGILTTSWNSKVAQSVESEATLFTVVFRANSNSNIGSLIAITGDVTAAEAYDAQLNTKDISLGVRTERGVVESGIFELYQNTPNPFAKETTISYRLPEAGNAKLSIYDVTGKVLRVYELTGVKGLNTVKVQKAELNAGGVLYYQLDAADHTATKRMVVID